MKTFYDEAKTAFQPAEKLASGGQGVIWRLQGLPDFLVKVYHKAPSSREAAKHKALRVRSAALSKVAALPVSLAFDHASTMSHVGIFIPLVLGHEIFDLYGTRSRIERFPNATFKFLIRTAYNLSVAFEELHGQGIIVGDVNEQNIKVLPDATVRLIDCDSFQIREGAVVYTSDVGTPLWTAPELHGKNLTGLERTQNHDLFGLAQLIFLLLFTGRHPFAGVPRSQRQLQPEEAIQQHAFSFAPAQMNIPLAPPPGCPRLDMLPPDFRDAFLQAFLKDSIRPNGRPTATQWRMLLERLGSQLATCTHNSSHQFWRGAASCPWCQVVQSVGVDLFPSRLGDASNIMQNANADDSYIRRLAGLRPFSFAITRPPAFTDLRASSLPPQPTGFWSGVHQLFSSAGWKQSWLGGTLQKHRGTVQQCEAQIATLHAEQQSIIAVYQREFGTQSAVLTKTVQALSQTGALRSECLQKVKDERQQEALRVFLQKFFLRKHKISQIGPVRLTTLLSFGVETAADITSAALSRIGLPGNATDALVSWRRQKEAQFRFDPSQPLSPSQLHEVERRFQERLRKLREEAASIEVKLNTTTQAAQQKLRVAEGKVHQLARQRDQAKLDVIETERALNSP